MAEFASRMLNRLSKTTTSNSGHKKNIESVDHPDSCINSTDSNSQPLNSKSQNDADLSCPPDHNDNNNFAPHSDHKNEENSDDSWLPNNNGTKSNNLTAPSRPNNPNRSQKTVNDSDDYEYDNENKKHHSWLPNYHSKRNSSKIASRSFNSNLSRKTERLIHILKLEDKNKDNNSSDKIHNKSSNHDQIHLNKEPESSISQQKDSCDSKGSVETESSGGVSTLVRRWKNITETKDTKSKHSSQNKSDDSSAELTSPKTNPLSQLAASLGRDDSKAVDKSPSETTETTSNDDTTDPSETDEKGLELEDYNQLISAFSRPKSERDEEEEDHEEEDYYNHDDWISNIAKPKSNWECLRQARYKEMLHTYKSYNTDIHHLLKTKSVSNFLSSDQRDKLELLMVSQAQGVESMKEKGKYKKEENEIDQNITRSRSCGHPNPVYESSSLWQNNTPQPSSIEMELIYDLRGYVEQLHQEILDLRKTITSHVNMQHESVQKKRMSTKQNCCVCNTMQADSFLYRCGHVCTCYDCGLELQYTSGKCPICEAPIVDVVRACGYGD